MFMKMGFSWRKPWLILVVMIITIMRPEAKAFPMRNTSLKTSTTAFSQPSSVSPSRSSTPPMTVLMNLKSSVAEPLMINTQASTFKPTPYQSQLPSYRVTEQVTVTQLPANVTSQPFSVNNPSITVPTGARETTGKKFRLINLIYIVLGVAVLVCIILVFIFVHRRKRMGRRTSKCPTNYSHGNDGMQFDLESKYQRSVNYSNGEFALDVVDCLDGHTVVPDNLQQLSTSRQKSNKRRDIIFGNADLVMLSNVGAARDGSRMEAVHQTNATVTEGIAKQFITVEGGTLKTDGVTFEIGPGCLKKDTQITMITDQDNFTFKSLLDLGLLSCYPRIVEFLPDGLTFESPVDLTIRLDGAIPPEQELFVLHGIYSSESERIIWSVVTDDKVNVSRHYVNMKINGFSLYTYIMSTRGTLARILSHLNNSFNCHAVALYRRKPTYIDVAVVLVSDFVETSSQLTHMVEENSYHICEKGAIRRVDTRHTLEMCVEFAGINAGGPHSFKIDLTQLDSVGMVIDQLRKIKQEIPTSGEIVIREIHKTSISTLWTLPVDIPEEAQEELVVKTDDPSLGDSATDDPDTDTEFPVVMRKTKLTGREITRLSINMGMLDWDSLAGLLDISYEEREVMRHQSHNSCHSKAETILRMFNNRKDFCRDLLKKYLEEIGRGDLKEKMKTQEQDEPAIVVSDESEVVLRDDTRLSSREMYRLSREIIDWDSLAGLMDIARAERESIRTNNVYPDQKSQAEKVLSLFNNRRGFCRGKLAEHLKELKYFDLEDIVKTGQYRVPPM